MNVTHRHRRERKLRAWSSFRKLSFRSLTLALTISVVSYLVLVPLFMLLYASVKSTEDKLPFESTVITLSNYARCADQPGDATDLSQHDAIHRGVFGGRPAPGDFIAWLCERTTIPGRAWFANLILVPMTIPSLLSAIAWIQLLDPRNGLVNVVLRSVFGMASGHAAPSTFIRFTACVSCRGSGWCRRPI